MITKIEVMFANERHIFEAMDVLIQADWLIIKRMRFSEIQDLDSLEKLVGDFGHAALEWCDLEFVKISIHKTACKFHFIVNNDDRVRCLAEQIDRMSTELNNIINR